jgi:hypothetical protein
MGNAARRSEAKDNDFVIEEDGDDGGDLSDTLRVDMSRLIAYAESADVSLQREVAESLANEAVKGAPVCRCCVSRAVFACLSWSIYSSWDIF